MKRAEAQRFWNTLRKQPARKIQLRKIAYESVVGLCDGAVALSNPVTAIAGLNGVGKSMLLRSIWAVLDPVAAQSSPGFADRLSASVIVAQVAVDQKNVERKLTGGKEIVPGSKEKIEVLFCDCPGEAIDQQQFFRTLTSLEDLCNGIDPVVLKKSEVELHSYVTGKKYTSVSVFEIEDVNGSEDVRPLFVLSDGHITYDTRSMSLGELSVCLLMWKLRQAPENSIILIEEPETFISHTAQSHLMDVLVRMSVQKAFSIIITTHSPHFMKQLGDNELLLMWSSDTGGSLAKPESYSRVLDQLGLEPSFWKIGAVEDDGAARFCKRLIRQFNPALACRLKVLPVGSAPQITALRRALPQDIGVIRLVGVYDGDQAAGANLESLAWPYCFLPMENGMEATFNGLVASNVGEASRLLGCESSDLQTILATLRGHESHEWFLELVRALDSTADHVCNQLLTLWLDQPGNAEAARKFVAELSEAFDGLNAR